MHRKRKVWHCRSELESQSIITVKQLRERQESEDEGWQDDLEVGALPSKRSSLGLNLHPAINCHPGVSHAGHGINVSAVPRIDVKLCPMLRHQLVDVKDPMMFFAKSRRAIAGTMNQLEISAVTYRGHCRTLNQ